MLTALVNWVERDIPPDAVVASTTSEPRLTRPLCPYPQYAHIQGAAIQMTRRALPAGRRSMMPSTITDSSIDSR